MSPFTRLALAGVLLAIVSPPSPAADDKTVTAKLVTLKGTMTMANALAEIKKQTGIDVEDRSDGPDVKLDLKDVPFWEALEAIAKDADVRVVPYVSEKKVGLAEGPYRKLPTSISGPFRSVVKRITAVNDLETDSRYYMATLEISWEPGLKPFFQEMPPRDLLVTDDKGRELKVEKEGSGRQPINGRVAEINVRLPDLPRTTPRIATLKGTVALVGPTKWLTFDFDNLGKAKGAKQEKDGVTATLSKVNLAKDLWEVEVSLDYPGDGLKLESFEIGDFVVFNEFALKKGDKMIEPNAGYETGGGAGTKAVVTYKYDPTDGQAFGAGAKADEWGIVYKTPGPMREIPVKFEFKELVLP